VTSTLRARKVEKWITVIQEKYLDSAPIMCVSQGIERREAWTATWSWPAWWTVATGGEGGVDITPVPPCLPVDGVEPVRLGVVELRERLMPFVLEQGQPQWATSCLVGVVTLAGQQLPPVARDIGVQRWTRR
jgi:hypothetical protein